MLNRRLLLTVLYTIASPICAVARTSASALTNATLPYALEIAGKGWKRAMQGNKGIRRGANVIDGRITYKAVADAFSLDFTRIEYLLE